MDWDKLRIFHAVAEAGSFTHAGHELLLSQSAVSRQVSALEADLKVPLFHRHARGLILTEQGEVLYRTANDVLGRLAEVKTRLMDSKEKPSGDLRITTTVGLGSVWLTPRIKEFMELYPDINVVLLLENRELDLSMREADVAIRLRRPLQPDLIQRKLFTVHHHVYASPEYLKKYGVPKSVDDLDKHKIMIFGETEDFLTDLNWLATVGREMGNPRRAALRVNSAYGLRRAVHAGAGLAILADYNVPSDSNLVIIDLPLEAAQFECYFVYPEEMKDTKRVTAFRDFIVNKAREWSF
ncbi:MAG TPA: LysR family transcriptional regulator [Aestuariivirga sp.]